MMTGDKNEKIRKKVCARLATISNKLLYMLTAQCKEDDFATLKSESQKTVKSFQVL
jgi:hypothetical protein